jgi:hypothetical protein
MTEYTKEDQLAILAKLREPFTGGQISKLPKPTKAQTAAVNADYKKGIKCKLCDAWHHPDVVHLDYVGHAALTDRLLSVDPLWQYQPMAKGADGLPAYDSKAGGLWIELTVGGMTRPGYGDADGKTGGNAIKEMIGDALRNAAMRFGCALDLWHKGDLHLDEDADKPNQDHQKSADELRQDQDAALAKIETLIVAINAAGNKMTQMPILKQYNVANLRELTPPDAADVIRRLGITLDEQNAKNAETGKS